MIEMVQIELMKSEGYTSCTDIDFGFETQNTKFVRQIFNLTYDGKTAVAIRCMVSLFNNS